MAQFLVPSLCHLPGVLGMFGGHMLRIETIINITLGQVLDHILNSLWLWSPSLLLWLIVFLANSECFKLYSLYLRHKVKATAKPTHILGTLSCQYENDELEFQFYLSPIFYAPILAIPSIHFDFLWLLVLGFRSTRSDGTRNAI